MSELPFWSRWDVPRHTGPVGSGLSVGQGPDWGERHAQDWESQTTTPVRLRFLWPLLGWAALTWVVDAAALWVMFLGFGVRLHPAVLLVGYGLANLINALPELTPGWLGVLETTLAATYAALGVPAGVAVVAVLCYRLVSYWLPVAAGVRPGLQMLAPRSGTSAVGTTGSRARDGGVMPGPIGLQGGLEHYEPTSPIDRSLLDGVGVFAPEVVILPLASFQSQAVAAGALAREHWTRLGARARVVMPGSGLR